MKKQVCSGLLALSMTASILSPAALAAEQVTVSDDNQNAIAVASDEGSSSANNDIILIPGGEEKQFEDVESGVTDLSGKSEESSAEESQTKSGNVGFMSQNGYVTATGHSGWIINLCLGTGASTAEEVVVPDEDESPVVAIGMNAFQNVTNLKTITIPQSVEEINEGAFSKCTKLTTVYYGGTQEQWDAISKDSCGLSEYATVISLGDYKFTTDEETNEVTIEKYNGSDKKITLPATYNGNPVTSIGEEAFQGKAIEQVTIPTSITSIGTNAFDGCTSLKTVYYDGKKKTGWNAISKDGCALPTDAVIICLGDYNFTIDSQTGEATISWYNVENPSPEAKITLPAEYQGHPVTKIGNAFNGYMGVTSVTIPEGITSIGYMAFNSCSDLESVTFPKTLTSIGLAAFMSCKKLKNITIPENVTSIGNQAFDSCTGLEEITISSKRTDDGKPTDKSIGSNAFARCTSLKKVTLPEGITSIEVSTFMSCEKLEEVTIPGSVTSIGNSAFLECASLKKITLPDTITSIGSGAFYGCGLESVTLPKNMVTIPKGLFYGCASLKEVTIPASVTSIGEDAFYNCSKLDTIYYYGTRAKWDNLKVTVPKNATVICLGDYTFQPNAETGEMEIKSYNGSDEKITIPATYNGKPVTSIGANAFENKSVTSITIPKSITSIGANAFNGCKNLTEVTIPSSVKTLGEAAFASCGLKTVTIEEGLKVIPENAFVGCEDLNTITIPKSVETIGASAFATVAYYGGEEGQGDEDAVLSLVNYGGTKAEWDALQSSIGEYNDPLTKATTINYHSGDYTYRLNAEGEVSIVGYNGTDEKVNIPATLDGCKVTSIGIGAFQEKTMTSVVIPEGVTSIDTYAFSNCESLTSVTLPKSMESIGQSAFNNSDSLKTVYYGGTQSDWVALNNNISMYNYPLTAAARYYTFDDYTYQVNGENEVTITKYNGTGTEAIIPPAIGGVPVTTIDAEAFQNCEGLKDVTIPTSVTSIGENAFSGCTALEKAYYDNYEENWNKNVKVADGNEPLTSVLTFKLKIICKGSEQVKISKGTHEMRIHGQSYGEYTFTWNEEQAGWTVQNSEGQYLSFADGELVLSDEPFVWHYDAKLYTTTEEKVQHKFWWWSYTTTKTVYWYLTGDGENLTISNSSEEADLALYDAVEATEHSFGDWVSDGNGTGTHSHTCTVCNKTETEDCTYGEDGYCTVCGAINPEKASVSVTAEVTKHTTRSGWWWWGCTTTTWTADITATGEGVDVATVEYSLDGENYKTGTSFTSKKEITTFYIRVTDSNDKVTNWIYEDGEVTQVTEQDSEQTPDQDSEQDSTEQG